MAGTLRCCLILVAFFLAQSAQLTWAHGHEECNGGKVFNFCGSPCALSCGNYEDRDTLSCIEECVEGCFCLQGMVELNGGCVLPEDCPGVSLVLPECGWETCPPYTSCRTDATTGESSCQPDCQVLNGGCPAHQQCRISNAPHRVENGDEDGKERRDSSHSDSDSDSSHSDSDSDSSHSDSDSDSSDSDSSHSDSDSSIDSDSSHSDSDSDTDSDSHDHGPHRRDVDHDRDHDHDGDHDRDHDGDHEDHDRDGDHDRDHDHDGDHDRDHDRDGDHDASDGDSRSLSSRRDDDYNYIDCVDPPYVLCDRSAPLSCDSEFLYCLQHSLTSRGYCAPSCLSVNGGCQEDQECVTQVRADQSTSLQCVGRSDLSTECPAGQTMHQCGDGCQETCQQRVSGEQFMCRTRCGPPACVCPLGLVLFRDRCVDPRLCYVLLQHPPAIDPLPLVDDDQYLFSLFSLDSSESDFPEKQFLNAVMGILASEGFPDVTVELHGIYEDNGLTIVVVISGDGMSVQTSAQLANLLQENSDQLPLNVQEVEVVEVDRVHSGCFWSTTLKALLLTCAGLVLLILAALVALVVAVCCLRRKKRRTPVEKLKMDVHKLIPEDELTTSTEKEKENLEYI